jgi:hypothetical protein
MEIRLHGTPTETTAALVVLAPVLDITNISRPYPDRCPSRLVRVYITAAPKERQ